MSGLKEMNWLENLVDYTRPDSLGFYLRKRRRGLIASLIDCVYRRSGHVTILDLGGRKVYWDIFEDGYLSSRNVKITLLNSEISSADETESKRFVEVSGDACDVKFGDNSFDIVHSNSTIEHVGNWEKVERFAKEARRLAPLYYVQTPYYWFPVEPHILLPFFHWLPDALKAKLLLHTDLAAYGRSRDMGHAMRRIEGARLLDRSQMAYLFPEAIIRFEWFWIFPKSLLAIRNVASDRT